MCLVFNKHQLWDCSMEIVFIVFASLLLFLPPVITIENHQDVYHNHFAVHVKGGLEAANRIAQRHGFENNGQIGSLEDHYLFQHHHVHKRSTALSHSHHDLLREEPEVLWFEQQKQLKRVKRDITKDDRNLNNHIKDSIHDPLFRQQWFINGGAYDGTDMNVVPAWQKGITGKGVVVTILDDGIQRDHPDLKQNYDPDASTDINGGDDDPMPQDNGDNRHGTRCAGEVAAVAFNEYCGVGIAYNSSIGGVRMLDGMVNDAVEARALSLNPQHIDIYSASWGPEDDGKTVDGPGPLAKKAFESGIKDGRAGKGSIFVWASGNGGRKTDNCNCDGYTNSLFTLSISSATQGGKKPWYLEECSSTLATTYSSGTPSHDASITTVDQDKRLRADKICTAAHTGTSASAPIAAGMCALVLEANSKITWRDMQHIVLRTSNPKPLLYEDGWATNGVGRKYSHKFGYGLMDGAAMVNLAEKWRGVGEQIKCESDIMFPNLIIPANPNEISKVSITTDGCNNKKKKRINFLEHVQCIISLKSNVRGALQITLISPLGTRSSLLFPRPRDHTVNSFDDWPFMSVHYWGESPYGNWTLEVKHSEHIQRSTVGNIIKKVQLTIYGTEEVAQEKGIGSDLRVKTKHKNVSYNVIGDNGNEQKHTQHTSSNISLSFEYEEENIMTKNYNHTPENMCKNTLFFDHLSRSCVSTCSNRTYLTFDRSCQPCSDRCTTCFGPMSNQCNSCNMNSEFNYYIKERSSCYKQCPGGYYKSGTDNHSGRTCAMCAGNCLKCNEQSKCISCKNQLVLDADRCVSDCPIGKYTKEIINRNGERSLSCDLCHKNCDTCIGPKPGQCAKCKKGHFYYQRSCVEFCSNGFVPDQNTGECSPCPQGCEICMPPQYIETGKSLQTTCTKCEENWELVDTYTLLPSEEGKCIPILSKKCKKGTFYQKKEDTCKQCDKSCASCFKTGSSGCTSCHPGHAFHIDSCIDRCPISTYFSSTQPNSTIKDVLLQGGVGECRHCPHACKTCDSPMRCTSCHTGYVLNQKPMNNSNNIFGQPEVECATSCGYGYFIEEGQTGICQKCDKSCRTCKTKNVCLSCQMPNTFLTPNGSCVADCPSGYFTSNGEDIISQYRDIDNDYVVQDSYSTSQCTKCHSSCATCSGPNSNECLSCQRGLALNTLTKSCHPCDPGRYFDTPTLNQCKDCHIDCAVCHGPNIYECDKCKPPLGKDNWNKTCVHCCGKTGNQNTQQPKLQSVVQLQQVSQLSGTMAHKTVPKYCCQCDKNFNCVSPSYEEKLDDASGKRSIFMISARPSMVSASRKTLMFVSVFVILCFVSFVIFKRWKREQRRRKGQGSGSGKRKHLTKQLVALFSFSREKQDDTHKRHRRVGRYSYRQIPTNSFSNSTSIDNPAFEESDSDEYECDIKRNGTRESLLAISANSNEKL